MALSSKLQAEELVVLDSFGLDAIKTSGFVSVLDTLNVDNALIISDKVDNTLELSSRNVPGVKVLRTDGLNVYDILKYKKLVLLESSVGAIEGRLMT
jgi:large subunit ribosomal protein L4